MHRVGHFLNACTGIWLVSTVPYSVTPSAAVLEAPLYLFPLPTPWVLAYTAWNATFSYGYMYSWSTRAVLVTALVVSHGILRTPHAWLGCRCLSMVANMVLRLNTFTYVYQPGQSILTALPGYAPSPRCHLAASAASLALCAGMYFTHQW